MQIRQQDRHVCDVILSVTAPVKQLSNLSVYAAGFTDSIRPELADMGIHVAQVHPGVFCLRTPVHYLTTALGSLDNVIICCVCQDRIAGSGVHDLCCSSSDLESYSMPRLRNPSLMCRLLSCHDSACLWGSLSLPCVHGHADIVYMTGVVKSNFMERAGFRGTGGDKQRAQMQSMLESSPAGLVQSPEEVAEQVYMAAVRRKEEVFVGPAYNAVNALFRTFNVNPFSMARP